MNTQEKKHTALPWTVRHKSIGGHRAISSMPKGFDICVVDGIGEIETEQDANAAYIVKACNSHAELVEALKEADSLITYGYQWSAEAKREAKAKVKLALQKAEAV